MVALAGLLHLFKKNVVLKVNIQFFSSFLDGFLTCVSLIEHLRERERERERERKKRGTYWRKQGEVVMDVEAFEVEPISGQSNDGLFIFLFFIYNFTSNPFCCCCIISLFTLSILSQQFGLNKGGN
jgi:hypothetical protein